MITFIYWSEVHTIQSSNDNLPWKLLCVWQVYQWPLWVVPSQAPALLQPCKDTLIAQDPSRGLRVRHFCVMFYVSMVSSVQFSILFRSGDVLLPYPAQSVREGKLTLFEPLWHPWMCRSVRWQPGERSEAPHPCPQWSSLTRATSGLSCADRANGRRLGDPPGSGAAGVVHGPDAAETEPRHANPEASGFGSSGDPPREGVQVHGLTLITSHTKKHLGCLTAKVHLRFKTFVIIF